MAEGKGQRRSGKQPSAGGMAPKRANTGRVSTTSNPQAVPPAVANRMARRVAIATGIPTLLGMATFVVSYFVVSKGLLEIPPAITLVTSGGFFLLGLVGLSYGVLSASWEVAPGSLLGIEQIGLNVSRLRSSFKQPPAAS